MKDEVERIIRSHMGRGYGIEGKPLIPAIAQEIEALINKARIREIEKFVNRSDSLGEEKYATRRIQELKSKQKGKG